MFYKIWFTGVDKLESWLILYFASTQSAHTRISGASALVSGMCASMPVFPGRPVCVCVSKPKWIWFYRFYTIRPKLLDRTRARTRRIWAWYGRHFSWEMLWAFVPEDGYVRNIRINEQAEDEPKLVRRCRRPSWGSRKANLQRKACERRYLAYIISTCISGKQSCKE